MKKLISALLLTSSIGTVSAGVFNLTQPDVIWDKKEISVCFADSSHFDKSYLSDQIPDLPLTSIVLFTGPHKEALEDIIKQEYTLERTGVHFTGWKDCQTNPESDVYLFRLSDSGQGLTGAASQGEAGAPTSVGKKRVFQKQGKEKKPYLALNTALMNYPNLSKVDDYQLTGVHEFGHLAGLQHEHADMREDGKRYGDSNCLRTNYSSSEGAYSSTEKVSVYDYNSVMNYCYGNVLRRRGLHFIVSKEEGKYALKDSTLITATPATNGTAYDIKIGLSRGDVHALSCLYRFDKKTKKEICRQDYDPATGKIID